MQKIYTHWHPRTQAPVAAWFAQVPLSGEYNTSHARTHATHGGTSSTTLQTNVNNWARASNSRTCDFRDGHYYER